MTQKFSEKNPNPSEGSRSPPRQDSLKDVTFGEFVDPLSALLLNITVPQGEGTLKYKIYDDRCLYVSLIAGSTLELVKYVGAIVGGFFVGLIFIIVGSVWLRKRLQR